MKQTIFTGSGVALITPFDRDGTVNFRKLKELIEWHLEQDTDAIVICGTTGENPTLTDDEHLRVIAFTIEQVNGRIPVIAGTGSNDTAHAVMMSQKAEQYGADALLCVTPYYNKTSQTGLLRHYTHLCEHISVPILLYNVPSRTGVNILPETYAALANIPNIVGIKEANGDISALQKTISLCGDALDIYAGNDDQTAIIAAMGGKGVISVLANLLPKQTHEMAMYGVNGALTDCMRMQQTLLPLCEALFTDVNPIPVKEAMNYLGMEVGTCRLPLCEMQPDAAEKLHRIIDKTIAATQESGFAAVSAAQ